MALALRQVIGRNGRLSVSVRSDLVLSRAAKLCTMSQSGGGGEERRSEMDYSSEEDEEVTISELPSSSSSNWRWPRNLGYNAVVPGFSYAQGAFLNPRDFRNCTYIPPGCGLPPRGTRPQKTPEPTSAAEFSSTGKGQAPLRMTEISWPMTQSAEFSSSTGAGRRVTVPAEQYDDIGRDFVQQYNEIQYKELEFVRMVRVYPNQNLSAVHYVLQAARPSPQRPPVLLEALAEALATHGVRVSYISTPRNIQRLPQIPPQLTSLVQYVSLPLPTVTNGRLPGGGEATVDMEFDEIQTAYDCLRDPFKQFVSSQSPNWIISDSVAHWMPEVPQECQV